MCELEYTIRQGRLDDVDQVYELLKAERWHVTSEIVKDNFRYYPECCYVADMQNGEIISYCHAAILDDKRGVISWFVTKPKYRGKGIGKKLFKICKDLLADRNIGVTCEPHKVSMYEKMGFKVQSTLVCSMSRVVPKLLQKQEKNDVQTILLNDSILSDVLEYDRMIHPSDRTHILKGYFADFSFATYVAVKEGKVVGYGCLSPGRDGNRLMPLYANDVTAASCLINVLLSGLEGTSVEVGYIEWNKVNVMKAFEVTELEEGSEFVAMKLYTKNQEIFPHSSIYSVMNYHNCFV